VTQHDALRIKRAMREVRVRFARDSEGSCIAQMVHSSHEGVPNVSWTKLYPSWIVAEHDQELVGCVQVCYGVPIGRLEFLSFVPNLAFRTRALAVRALLGLGSLSLLNAGATAIAGTVGFDQRSFKEILKANGCAIATSGNVFVRAA
jgi:hypothetical protein